MFNNFHEIKAVISNHQGFRASFYGMAEYVNGMMNNRIKFKNHIVQAKLYFKAKFESNSVKFENNVLHTVMRLVTKTSENAVKITNEIKMLFISLVKPKESVITFLDKPIQKLNILFAPKLKENEFEFENADTKVNVALQGRTDENEIFINNNNVEGIHSTVSLVAKTDNNNFLFKNSSVNASAWKFLTLGDISGTLAEIEKSPLEYLGRKKIIQ